MLPASQLQQGRSIQSSRQARVLSRRHRPLGQNFRVGCGAIYLVARLFRGQHLDLRHSAGHWKLTIFHPSCFLCAWKSWCISQFFDAGDNLCFRKLNIIQQPAYFCARIWPRLASLK